jgi:hypothetical protein
VEYGQSIQSLNGLRRNEKFYKVFHHMDKSEPVSPLLGYRTCSLIFECL